MLSWASRRRGPSILRASARSFAEIPSRNAAPTTVASPDHKNHVPASPSSFPGPILRENELEDNLFRMFDQDSANPFPIPEKGGMNSIGDTGLSKDKAMQIMEAMITTRVAHNVSRRAALSGMVHYTIGPGGHESVAAVAAAMKVTDPALLHYRDTAFQIQRALQKGDDEMLLKMMRSYAVSSLDKASGGRHKVLGDKELNIIPTTSTIASHFPRAAALAASIPLAKGLKLEGEYPNDSVVLGSGGDASINHASFLSAVNYLKYTSQGCNIKVPSLFMVTDNGIGISVKTPEGWVSNLLQSTGFSYHNADGTDIFDVYIKAKAAVRDARAGSPTMLHVQCSRLFNHAGSDAGAYQSPAEIAYQIARDPLPAAMHLLVREGVTTKAELRDMYKDLSAKTEATLIEVCKEPKLTTLEQVSASLIAPKPAALPIPADTPAPKPRPLIMKQHINSVLKETLTEDKTAVIVGQDVGKKGGNYGVTDGLQRKFGNLRVRDALLDETSILGMANGFALNRIFPIVEVCYLAYIHNAIDQIRGEASTLSFFSDKQYQNGMIVRVAGGGLTEFGGHFHNENSLSSLLDIPGLVLVYPSNGPDYVRLFRTLRDHCAAGRVVVIIEPIKAYALKKFGKDQDFMFPYPAREEKLELGELRRYGEGKDLAIFTYGNGVVLSLEAQQTLREEHGIDVTIIEQPTLRGGEDPTALPKALSEFDRVVFADECRFTGAISHEIISAMTLSGSTTKCKLVAAADSLIPLGEAARVEGLYLSPTRIVDAARDLMAGR